MELSKDELIDLLREKNKERLFAEVYEAVAEQYMLLALKARHLYSDPQYTKWFLEQHDVLVGLQKQRDIIDTVYKFRSEKSYPKTDLGTAMWVMQDFYYGFDNDNQILQTWGELNRAPAKGDRNNSISQTRQDYVQGDLFNLLRSCNPNCTSIPIDERMGYSHQDLAISFSCSDSIITKLNDFFKIDYFEILDETAQIFFLDTYQDISSLHGEMDSLKLSLSQYKKMGDDIKNHAEIIDKVEILLSKLNEEDIHYFLYLYSGFAAKEVYNWLTDTLCYFKSKQPVKYRWVYEVDELQKNDSDYLNNLRQQNAFGKISISRASIIQLIRKGGVAGLDDLALEISRNLGMLYNNLLMQDPNIEESAPDRTIEMTALDSDTKSIHPDRAVAYLAHLTEWYDKNKALFNSADSQRKSKVNVATWLCGLKAYDMKKGIPNGEKLRLERDIFDKLRQDNSLYGMNANSNVSFERYHLNIKNIIPEVTDIIVKQKEHNKKYPFNGTIYTVRPLWDQ